MSGATASSHLAAGVIGELIHLGVTDVVVSPGSRSQALALIAAEAEQAGHIRLHVRIDERSAAFFALGIARETGIPAPVIVTSGSATANLMPALLEGHHARVPMLLITADRPEELRGVRASQTVTTMGYFEPFCRLTHDVPAGNDARLLTRELFRASRGSNGLPAGPAHLNIAFRDPLSGGDGLLEHALSSTTGAEAEEAEPEFVTARGETYVHRGTGDSTALAVVIAGADAGTQAADFAHAAGIPLLAEPSSGARFGREAIQYTDRLIEDPEIGGLIEQVIVFGHPTLSRAVLRLVQRPDVETVVIDAVGAARPEHGIEVFNPGRAAKMVARQATVAPEYDPAAMKRWLGHWVVADRELRAAHTTVHAPDLEAARQTGYKERSEYARAEVARMREPVTREHLTETLWLATWPHDRLVVASSRLIRVLNRTAAPRNIRVHSNRGLAGIDGTIATALGIATASQSHEDPRQAAGTTRVLIGDLALLHDVGSLLLTDPELEPHPRIQLVVGNDGGGSIFDQLEVAATANRDAFDRVLFTPRSVDLEQLAVGYGWAYEKASNRGELERAFTAPVLRPSILEVPLDRAGSEGDIVSAT